MSNIDCDQIILYGLVAMFSIYIYKTMFDGNTTQQFTIGGQDNSDALAALAESNNNNAENIANQINNINSKITNSNMQNANMANNVNKNIQNTINNAMKNNTANMVNMANNSSNNLPSNSVSGNDIPANNSGYVPAEFKAPEPGTNMDSVPKSYEVGSTKADSCFPQDILSSDDLLPKADAEAIKQFTEDQSIGDGILKGVNFLGAGYHVGVNSVGQSLRNANLQLRSEPPNPQTQISPWLNSSIAPDLQRRPLELTESCAKAEGVDSPSEIPGETTNDGTLINDNNENLNSI